MTARGNAVPEPQSGDSDGVSTALESAEIFRARGDLHEAARWLRRGAEIAGDEGNDQRALALAQAAVNLGDSGSAAAEADGADEAVHAPSDDVMAELFDQPLPPTFQKKAHEPAPAVAAPPIPPAAALPSIPEPPSLLDAAAEVVAKPAAVAPEAAAAPALPRPAIAQSEPPRDPAPSSLPVGPPLRPSGIVSVTASPPAPLPPEADLRAAAVPEFDDNTPATVPQTDTGHLKRTAIWADQAAFAQAMLEEPSAPVRQPEEPNRTWEDQTESESTSAKWAAASAPGVPLRSEPPPKPPRAPTVSKLDIEWDAQSAGRVEGTPLAAAPTAAVASHAALALAPAAAPAPRVARAIAPTTRRALRGTLQATTEDGVFVFVPLAAQQKPELHTHEALVVLVVPSANLEA